jgi:hypothetical protein
MRESRPWTIWATVIAVLLAGVGAYFFYNLFRQDKSELIEAIPSDAAYIFALNDNDAFLAGTTPLAHYLDELFVLDALPAYETMRKKLPAGDYDLTVSGHLQNDGVGVLFNTHADKAAFKRLLRALSIDPNNFNAFEGYRIYTYGTNFKSVKFAYVNHIISFSTDLELLKRAILQHAHPKNLLSDKQFKEMYDLSEKNRKQNWLIINPERFTPHLSSFLQERMARKLDKCLEKTGWTALQLRFSGKDMFLSGYAQQTDAGNSGFLSLLGARTPNDDANIEHLFPSNVDWYIQSNNPEMWVRMIESNPLTSEKEASVVMACLPAKASGCFSLHNDTCSYTYCMVLLSDSSREDFLSAFYCNDTRKADSIRNAHKNGIYPIPHKMSPMAPNLAADSMGWVMAWNNTLVFAPSLEAATLFTNNAKKNEVLTQNRYYPFVDDAVASSSSFNFVFFHNEASALWESNLSEKGKASHTGQDLRVLSLSCETVEKGNSLVPVNLFLHF